MTSRVVPAIGEVIAASRRANWFNILDFPAFGGPRIATAMPSQPFAAMTIVKVRLDLIRKCSCALRHFPLYFGRQLLVREIDRRFEMRHKPQEPLAPAAIDPAEMAVELAQGLAALRFRFGRREIGDRLGLGQ